MFKSQTTYQVRNKVDVFFELNRTGSREGYSGNLMSVINELEADVVE